MRVSFPAYGDVCLTHRSCWVALVRGFNPDSQPVSDNWLFSLILSKVVFGDMIKLSCSNSFFFYTNFCACRGVLLEGSICLQACWQNLTQMSQILHTSKCSDPGSFNLPKPCLPLHNMTQINHSSSVEA